MLAPVFRDEAGDLRLVLLVRTDNGGVHGGQLGLPGGKAEPDDADLLATALREAEEEIGLTADEVEVLGELEPVLSGPSRFRVHPFLARIPGRTAWQLAPDEVVDVLTPRVVDLAEPAARQELLFRSTRWPDGLTVDGIAIGEHVLWGMTLRLLDDLVPRLVAGEWPV